ncbi:hypothetical protein CDAR_215561 [Caerostris darwini]|uniref:EGF-like domain-containing protein n=1 Tax=Caerostris darwini TaxID=1538125 RepID=A0AAV4X837_9ARAC|nr:hypothetical protein CDAR_215561 [Caerostris darwini]
MIAKGPLVFFLVVLVAPGFICECTIGPNCRSTEACINNQCQDPCASPTACGTKARCQTVNHRTSCSCPPGRTGDPNVKCSKL